MKIVCLALCGIMLLAACAGQGGGGGGASTPAPAATATPAGSGGGTATTAPAAPTDEPVTITILTRGFNDTSTVLNNIMLVKSIEWMAENPHVTVINDSVHDEDQFNNRFRIAVASDEMPTFFMTYGGGAVRAFIEGGLVLDMEQSGLMGRHQDFFGHISPNAYADQRFADMPGSTFGFAMDMFATGIYYNKLMFEEYNVKVPETIEELEEAFEAFLQAGYIPMPLGNRNAFIGGHLSGDIMMKMGGSDLMRALAAREVKWTDDVPLDALRLIDNWNQRGFLGPDAATLENEMARTIFRTGESPMLHQLVHVFTPVMAEATIDRDQVGIMPFPYFSDKPQHRNAFHSGTNTNYSFYSGATDLELDTVMSLVKTIFGQDAIQEAVDAAVGAMIVTRTDVSLPTEVPPGVAEYMAAHRQGTDFGKEAGEYDSNPAIRNLLRDSIQGMTAGVSPQETANILQQAIDRG